jgi:hypothetical protein
MGDFFAARFAATFAGYHGVCWSVVIREKMEQI